MDYRQWNCITENRGIIACFDEDDKIDEDDENVALVILNEMKWSEESLRRRLSP